jgi:hypothetical protein
MIKGETQTLTMLLQSKYIQEVWEEALNKTPRQELAENNFDW